MYQTKKGNSWNFGMKMHIGVDDALGLINSITTTPANVHDITQADKLLYGKEQCVWGGGVLKNVKSTRIARWVGLLRCAPGHGVYWQSAVTWSKINLEKPKYAPK